MSEPKPKADAKASSKADSGLLKTQETIVTEDALDGATVRAAESWFGMLDKIKPQADIK